MRVLLINVVCGIRSTGRICTDIAQELEKEGHEVKIAYGRERVPNQFLKYAIKIGNDFYVDTAALKARAFDDEGLACKNSTKKFLKWADKYDPNLLWLHNIHGYYINYELLFQWIKSRPNMQVKWTLHDCWAFTGHCTHFSFVGCNQWKKECYKCCQLHEYPACYGIGQVKRNYYKKKASFTGVNNMTLITPSKWLANLVKQSFFKNYPVEVHYNTVDRSIFKPTKSDFRKKYGIENKIVILGVASTWGERKGLYDFYKLAKMLDDKYVIVLVGLTERQIKQLPKNIKGVKRTNSPSTLAEIYTSADVYINPSVEETFGMTQLEAYECGTPSIVYKHTSCEEVANKIGNRVVPRGVENIYEAITGKKFVKTVGGGISKIICFQKLEPIKLASVYSSVNFFVNPTYEDTFPTVNLEAISCGTTVICYDTGGCKETLNNCRK